MITGINALVVIFLKNVYYVFYFLLCTYIISTMQDKDFGHDH